MDDNQIHGHIEQLVEEEQTLYARAGHDGLSVEEHARLDAIKVELDRYWDLLRQRKALAEFGRDPDDASLRAPGVVENYEG